MIPIYPEVKGRLVGIMSFPFNVGTVGAEGNPVAGAFVSFFVPTHLDKPKGKGFTLLCFFNQEPFANDPIGQGALSATLDVILIDVRHAHTLPIQQVLLHRSLPLSGSALRSSVSRLILFFRYADLCLFTSRRRDSAFTPKRLATCLSDIPVSSR